MAHYGFFSTEQLASAPKRSISLVPQCSACRLYRGCKNAKMPPSGKGRKRILIVGEGAGKNEEEQGLQFVGQSGQLLERTLAKCGIDFRRDCWVTNSVICRAKNAEGGNRTPTDKEIEYCRPTLIKTIQDLKPEIVIPLGGVAVKSLLGWLWKSDVGSISRWDGWRIPNQKINAWVCPTWHPAYILRTDYGTSQRENEVRTTLFERHLKAACELQGRPWETVPEWSKQVRVEMDDRRAADAIQEMMASGRALAFDYETTGLKPDNGQVQIHSCSVSDGITSVAFPWQGRAIEAMREFLRSEVPKIGANIKFEARFSRQAFGFWPRNWKWDLVLNAHVLDNRPDICSVKFQSFVNLGVDPWDEEIRAFLRAKGANEQNRIREFPLAKTLKYCGLDSLHEWKTSEVQAGKFGISSEEFAVGDLKKARTKMFTVGMPEYRAYELFHEGQLAFAKIEANGIRIDTDYLERISGWIGRKIKKLDDGLRRHKMFDLWRKAHGQKTNLGSDAQLATVVYDVLKCPCKDWTDKGKPKADRQSIQHAIEDMEPVERRKVRGFFRNLDQMESLKKLKSTHLRNLSREVVNGLIHPFFNLSGGAKDDGKGGARTFRGSCDSPAFHQIPIRDPNLGRLIRRCFIAREGNHFVEIDFGGHEYKCAAAIWRDKNMMLYASDPTKDIHRDMAAKIFQVEPGDVTKEMRYVAKNQFVFPVLYGSYYIQMAQRIWTMVTRKGMRLANGKKVVDHFKKLGITKLGKCDPKQDAIPGTFEHHVKTVERWFMAQFPKFAKDKDKWYDVYRQNLGFPLATGFWVGGLYSKNFTLNAKIQGPAFHCLLWALIEIQKELKRRKMKALITGNIHDSIIADVPEEELQEFLNIVKHYMTVAIRKAWDWVIVPLEIEAQVSPLGGSWWGRETWEDHKGVWAPKTKKVAA